MRPFGPEDETLDPRESMHRRSQRKPEIPLRDPRASDESLLYRAAKEQEVYDALGAMAPRVEGPEPATSTQTRGFVGRMLRGPQWQMAGLADVAERMGTNPLGLSKVPQTSDVVKQTPSERITPLNWQRGMGQGIVERNISPRVRAQGHLLGGGLMFATSMPPFPEPTVTRIQY